MARKQIRYEIPEGTEQSRCTGPTCGATIYWVKTAKGKDMCVDADGAPHWATCPDVAKFKRKG